MKKLTNLVQLQIFCLLLTLGACAQSKYGIAKTHAYVRETVQGNIPTDNVQNPEGTGIDHLHTLYVETTGKVMPTWHMVYTNSGAFSIQAEPIDSSEVRVGKLKGTDEVSVITAKRGNKLWRLELLPMKARNPDDIVALLETNDVVITGEWKGEQFKLPVAKEVVLESIFYK